MRTKRIHASKPIIAISAPVKVTAAVTEGEQKSPAKFSSTFYTGGALQIAGWDLPVVVDLAGLARGNVLVANLDHKSSQRVGNFDVVNDGKTLVANGTATAKTPARDEVVGSAVEGYQWQSSLEVNPQKVEEVKAGKTVQVNGQEFTGPLYVTRKGTLKGFAFVSHGADDNTTVSIAAIAATSKEKEMEPKVKAWIEAMGFDVETLTEDQIANLTANYEGQNGKKATAKTTSNPFEKRKIEAKRRREIREIADRHIELRNSDEEEIIAIEKMHDHAISANMTPSDFRLEIYESELPESRITISTRQHAGITNRVLEAAVCETGQLSTLEKDFTDQELQIAHDHFPHGISLGQLFMVAAQANGYQGIMGGQVTLDIQRAAFGMNGHRPIRAAGFSTLTISDVIAATANKFLHQGWMAVDLTPLRISGIRNVKNFQQTTTVSLTGHLQFEKIGADGEIKHGTLSDLTYTNQADTYAAMLAITRKDIINDDLGALTQVPMRLGRGGALKLNDIFWTEFLGLVSANFFASGNNNINTGVADATIGGLDATETIFMNQTDPDGKPLAAEAKILVVPSAIKNKMLAIVDPTSLITSGATGGLSDTNVFRGRFRVESSPYISNSSYTGYTTVGWWMLADPTIYPVIEIAALNGKVEPTVESADAEFNVLGVQMRGYSDIGVHRQEYRGGVYADGGSS